MSGHSINLPWFPLIYFQADDNDAIHVISVAEQTTVEKPPEYDTVVILDPPCYDDAIKLNPANLLHTKYYQDVSLPNYNDLEITGSLNVSNCSSATQDHANSHQSGAISAPNGTHCSNSVSQTNNNVANSCNPSTVITIEQTASDLSNEHIITHKSADSDSVASESSALS